MNWWGKLVAQLQPTAPPAGMAIAPAQVAQAFMATRFANRSCPASRLQRRRRDRCGTIAGRLDSSTVGRVKTSSYWCNSLGGQGGGDSSNEECVVPVRRIQRLCRNGALSGPRSTRRAIQRSQQRVGQTACRKSSGTMRLLIPLPGILNNLVLYRWESFRGVDAARGRCERAGYLHIHRLA